MDGTSIFDFIHNDDWASVEKIIKSKNIDVNIRDKSKNYPLSFAVINNKKNIVKMLLENGAKIDITDQDMRSILFYPIKFKYNHILDLLLEANLKGVNIPIIDIIDIYGQNALFYAVKNKNIYAVKQLIKFKSPINVIDKNGINCLHLAVSHAKDYDICKILIDNGIDINKGSRSGENALHLACIYELYSIAELLIKNGINVNRKDYEHEYSALHYTTVSSKVKLTQLLLNNNANKNSQDYTGNTPLHYILKNKNELLLDIFIKNNADFNIFNFKSNIPLHVALFKNNDIDVIKKIIKPSKLNFQNIYGDTPLHIIVKKKLWRKLINQLKVKKLDIFIKNSNNKRPIDYIEKEEINEFIDLVTDSYYFILKNQNFVWREEWEENCRKEIKNHSITKCKLIIKKKLFNRSKGKNSCINQSYPVKINKSCIHIPEYSNVNYCAFAGTPLEVSIGLVYLVNKHNNICTSYAKDYKPNEDLCDYYRKIGIYTKSKCEFLNYELVWINNKLFFPMNFKNKISKCITKDKSRFIIFPLGIEMRVGNHANYIIYDTKLNEVERFEPYGSEPPYKFNYLPNKLDNLLSRYFYEIDNNIKYVRPVDYLPKIGFQSFDADEIKQSKLGDPDGFCALWSIWYVDQRMIFPDMNRKKLVQKMLKNIKGQKGSFKNMIRNYSFEIVSLRDKILSKSNLNINDWINDLYTEEQVDLLMKNINESIINDK